MIFLIASSCSSFASSLPEDNNLLLSSLLSSILFLTIDRALLFSYQGANIRKISTVEEDNEVEEGFSSIYEENVKTKTYRCLINPDKNKPDYDDKIISVHYEDNFQPGDVFEWLGTNSYWLIYL